MLQVAQQQQVALRPLAILLALAAGVWLPLRMVVFHDFVWLDPAVDLLLFVYGAASIALRRGDGDEARRKHWYRPDGPALPMFVDALLAFPAVSLLMAYGIHASWLLLFKLVILRRLLDIRTMVDGMEMVHPVAARLAPLAVILPLVVHCVACGWIALGSGTSGPDPDKFLEYARGVYWAITTLATVGYGDTSAKTIPQMAYAASTMMLGVGFFGYVLSNVASLLARLDAARIQQDELMDRVEAFMRYNRVPNDLRLKVRSYFRYLWDSHRGYNSGSVMSDLPRALRADVAQFLNADIIEKVPILKGADPDFVRDIVLELASRVAVPGEKLFNYGEEGDAMYFIQHGTIEIISGEGKLLASLKEGSFFGETALLTSKPRSAAAQAESYCDLFVLSRQAFEAVLARHPQFRTKFNVLYHTPVEPVKQAG